MKRPFLTLLLSLCLSLYGLSGQTKKQVRLTVAFYNLENLFDTIDGDNNDEDFLPEGKNQWTPEKYKQKLHNMAYALSQIGSKHGPDIVGLCEIENRQVLQDLLREPELRDLGYEIVHFDSPDKRGIDCALFYRSKYYQLLDARPHPVRLQGEEYIKTRDVLEVNGLLLGEPVSFLVAHWPSRVGGEQISLRRRMQAAQVMRSVTDSLLQANPANKVILMGDFNDDPTSASVVEGLRAKTTPEGLAPEDLYNPMAKIHASGRGTLAYRDVWNQPRGDGQPHRRARHLAPPPAGQEEWGLCLYIQRRLPDAEDGALQGLSLPYLLLGALPGGLQRPLSRLSLSDPYGRGIGG